MEANGSPGILHMSGKSVCSTLTERSYYSMSILRESDLVHKCIFNSMVKTVLPLLTVSQTRMYANKIARTVLEDICDKPIRIQSYCAVARLHGVCEKETEDLLRRYSELIVLGAA
jgi:hypothetical protein